MADFKVTVRLVATRVNVSRLRTQVQAAFNTPIKVNFDAGAFGRSGGAGSLQSGISSVNSLLAQCAVQTKGVAGARRILSVETARATAVDKANASAQIERLKVAQQLGKLQEQQRVYAKRLTQDASLAARARAQEVVNFSKMGDQASRYFAQYEQNISKNAVLTARWQATMAKLQDPTAFGKTTAERSVNARAELSRLISESEKAGVSVETVGQKMKRLFSAHLGTALVMTAIHAIQKSLRELFTNVTEVNTALTQFQIVSRVSGSELNTFAKDAFASAKKISASATDVIDAATVYKRLGYSTSDALQFSELTTMYSKIGAVPIGAAEENVTAMVKAFDLSSSDLELALDKMVYVGNNFPISAAQLGEGLQNAASSLAVGGNTLEQSMALLTSAFTTTQD